MFISQLFSFSTIKAYNVFLGQLELIARDHELVAEGLQEKVAERLKSIHKETTNNRKNVCILSIHKFKYVSEGNLSISKSIVSENLARNWQL